MGHVANNLASDDAIWELDTTIDSDDLGLVIARDTKRVVHPSYTIPLMGRCYAKDTSDNTDNRTIRVGFLEEFEDTSGMYFRVTRSTVNWVAVTQGGGGEEATDTGISSASAGGRKLLEITWCPKPPAQGGGLNEVRFYIDGVLKATHTDPLFFFIDRMVFLARIHPRGSLPAKRLRVGAFQLITRAL